MFRTVISSSPFCTDVANRCFQNISGDHYGGDISFLSTLRALLAPRLSEDDTLRLNITRSALSDTQLDGLSSEQISEKINSNINPRYHNTLYVHFCSHPSAEANQKCVNSVYESFAKTFSDWTRVDKVTMMFKQRKFAVACFINPKIHSSVVVVEGGDLRRYHMIQASISVFLPWHFEGEGKGLTEEELKLVGALYPSSWYDEFEPYD